MKDDFLLTSCGSPHYASPEVVMGHKYDGSKSDVWSCGVILYAMITGKLPFDDENIRRLLAKVKNGVYSIPKFLPRDVSDLIQRMLVADPAKRISIAEIKQHPFWLSRSYIPPKLIVPVHELLDANVPVKAEELDEEILLSLISLGWGSEENESLLIGRLSSGGCLELVFYRLLEQQKIHIAAKLASKENLAPKTKGPPSIPSIQDFQASSRRDNEKTRPRSQSGVGMKTVEKEHDAPAPKSVGIIEEGRRRTRLPRDKRQGSVKNLIAILSRKKSSEFKVNNEVQTGMTASTSSNKTVSVIDVDEIGYSSDNTRKRRSRTTSGESKKLKKTYSKAFATRLGKALTHKSATAMDRDKLDKIEKEKADKDKQDKEVDFHISSSGGGSTPSLDRKSRRSPKLSPRDAIKHPLGSSEIRREEKKEQKEERNGRRYSLDKGPARDDSPAPAERLVVRVRSNTVTSDSGDAISSSDNSPSSTPGAKDMIPMGQAVITRQRSSSPQSGRGATGTSTTSTTSSKRTPPNKSPAVFIVPGILRQRSQSPGGKVMETKKLLNVQPIPLPGQEDVSKQDSTARRTWFSTFIRQNRRKSTPTVPLKVQLTTNNSKLSVCLQIMGILYELEDANFKFTSKSHKFTVRQSKPEFLFHICLKSEQEEEEDEAGLKLAEKLRLSGSNTPVSGVSSGSSSSGPASMNNSRNNSRTSKPGSRRGSVDEVSQLPIVNAKEEPLTLESGSSSPMGTPRGKKPMVAFRTPSDSEGKDANEVVDPDKKGEVDLATYTLIVINFRTGDLQSYNTVVNKLRAKLDL